MLKVILSSTELIKKSYIYGTLDPWLGQGLLTSTGEKWFHHRKMITPAFHFGVVDTFFEIMSEKAEILNQVMEEEIKKNPGKPIDFFDFANRCALDILCETAMGVNVDVQRNLENEYMAALPKVAEIALKRMYRPWLALDCIFYRTKYGAEFKSALDTMNKFTMEIDSNGFLIPSINLKMVL
ncbi:cytochrome P450 4C1-like [Belonocnema kinseyi]|uniref:cytochrome P450 4C1-like n=1 Tax=Belonocnema kinseyi TaxID=2817044 RepID=UPI00143DA864|nr:cytochrome P450 4C1-like [Belonocnema kinseyi]